VQSVGGFNPKASLGNARLTRDGKTVTLDLRSVLADGTVKVIGDGKGVINPASPTVKPGDVLMVDTYETVFTAWGGVNRPGRIEFPESGQLSVVDALVLAGGPGQFADLKNAAILRPKDGSNDWDTVYVDLQGLVKTPDPKAANKKPDKNAPATPVKPAGAELTLRPNDILFIPVKDPDNRKSFGLRDAMQMFMFGGFLLR
jgi:protein involved in polysaccharide export with SLBB domain